MRVLSLRRDEIGGTVDGAATSLESAPVGQYVPGGGTTVSSPPGGGRGGRRGRGHGAGGGRPANAASAARNATR